MLFHPSGKKKNVTAQLSGRAGLSCLVLPDYAMAGSDSGAVRGVGLIYFFMEGEGIS
jgi:hypothetical protein